MSDSGVPSVTIIVPTRPGQSNVPAVTASLALDYPIDQLEIIVARGKQPSVQRNAALREAKGDLIYFLDDDSVPLAGNLRRAVHHFSDAKVQMIGGPNVCPDDAPFREQVFARVLASWIAFGPSRARYAPVGQVRDSSEKELILCNLLARREPLLELGGFNEALYPNEENALMDQLQSRGGRLIYDPELLIHRRPRPSLKSFARMLLTYGRGRAEQFRVHPTFGSALNFVPPLFCLYLLLAGGVLLSGSSWGKVFLIPFGFYAVAVLGQMVVNMVSGRFLIGLATLPLIVLTHVLYGLGFWRGLFTSLRKENERPPGPPVVLEKIGRP